MKAGSELRPAEDNSSRRSALFESDISRSNMLLARTFHQELVRSGRSRTEMIGFINCLLSLITSELERNRRPLPLVALDTGVPSRRALHQLLLHEADPDAGHRHIAGVVVIRLRDGMDGLEEARHLRHMLRSSDVVTALGMGWLAAVVYPRTTDGLAAINCRVVQGGNGRYDSAVVERIKPGTSVTAFWRGLLRACARQAKSSSTTIREHANE